MFCERCGTAKGVQSCGFCRRCEQAINQIADELDDEMLDPRDFDDHMARNEERRQMGYGHL